MQLEDSPLLAAARRLWSAHRLDAALELFQQAVTAAPDNVRVLVEAARALGLRHEIAQAERLLERAEQLAGDDLRAAPQIAQSYRLILRPHKAIRAYRRLCDSGDLAGPYLGELAALYEQTNQIEAALDAISRCVQSAGDRREPQLLLARIQRRRGESKAAEEILTNLTELSDAHPLLHVQAWAELCHLRDQQEDFAGAIAAIGEAKSLLRRFPSAVALRRQAAALNETFRRIYTELDRPTLEQWKAESPPAEPRCAGVVHLLGFPRSGTTLLEQVLDGHPRIADSPERVVFSRDVFPAMYRPRGDEPLSLDSLKAITASRLEKQRRRYLDYMEAALGEPLSGRVHLDKNPNHTSLLAGLFRLFPESRFLFALRDPRDVIVSTYLRYFPLTEYSVCFLDWESLCTLYESDMSIWLRMRELLTDGWLEVKYEDTVADLEAQARRCLSFLELDWDESVLNYRERSTEKLVNSPSHQSVRKPVYTRAVGRWRNYQRYLEPHLERLQPWIRRFGYQ